MRLGKKLKKILNNYIYKLNISGSLKHYKIYAKQKTLFDIKVKFDQFNEFSVENNENLAYFKEKLGKVILRPRIRNNYNEKSGTNC